MEIIVDDEERTVTVNGEVIGGLRCIDCHNCGKPSFYYYKYDAEFCQSCL